MVTRRLRSARRSTRHSSEQLRSALLASAGLELATLVTTVLVTTVLVTTVLVTTMQWLDRLQPVALPSEAPSSGALPSAVFAASGRLSLSPPRSPGRQHRVHARRWW